MAWNVCRMTLDTDTRMNELIATAEQYDWGVILVADVRADTTGIMEYGENENRWVFVHSQRAGILMCDEWANQWEMHGKIWHGKGRVVWIDVPATRLTAVYHPLLHQAMTEREPCRRAIQEASLGVKKGRWHLIGGDWNAQMGRARPGTDNLGRFSLDRGNEAGRNMMNWANAEGLAWIDSFFNMPMRGTWRHRTGSWHELDGFFSSAGKWRRLVQQIQAHNASHIGDHQPKVLTLTHSFGDTQRAAEGPRRARPRTARIAYERLAVSRPNSRRQLIKWQWS